MMLASWRWAAENGMAMPDGDSLSVAPAPVFLISCGCRYPRRPFGSLLGPYTPRARLAYVPPARLSNVLATICRNEAPTVKTWIVPLRRYVYCWRPRCERFVPAVTTLARCQRILFATLVCRHMSPAPHLPDPRTGSVGTHGRM